MIRKRNSYIKIELTYNTTGVIIWNVLCPTTWNCLLFIMTCHLLLEHMK